MNGTRIASIKEICLMIFVRLKSQIQLQCPQLSISLIMIHGIILIQFKSLYPLLGHFNYGGFTVHKNQPFGSKIYIHIHTVMIPHTFLMELRNLAIKYFVIIVNCTNSGIHIFVYICNLHVSHYDF